jgi:hypothetical protein
VDVGVVNFQFQKRDAHFAFTFGLQHLHAMLTGIVSPERHSRMHIVQVILEDIESQNKSMEEECI